jgi:dipeptidyl aminopeptidase/acylaminoacyl peptidase
MTPRRLLVLLLIFGNAVAQAATPTVDEALSALDRMRQIRDVALSPDGQHVAWGERVRASDGNDARGRVHLAPVAGGEPRRVTAVRGETVVRERGPVFSPDSRTLAFLSDAAHPGQLQIYIAPVAGGPARRLTDVKGQLAELHFAPDGKQVGLLYVAGSAQETGALVAHAKDSGVVTEHGDVQRIAVVDVATGALREISPPNLYVYDFDWSPDGRWMAAEAVEGSGTNDYWIAQLYRVEAESGTARSLWKPSLQIAGPRVSPDGRQIALIHGLMSDEGQDGGDVMLVPADGGTARNATPRLPASVKRLAWRTADELLLVETRDGGTALERLTPSTGQLAMLWSGTDNLLPAAVAHDVATTALVRQSLEHAPDVWAGPIGEWKQISHFNDDVKPLWGAAQSLHWESDGARVQGYLLPPPQVEPGKRYPLVVHVHGGPAAAHGSSWPTRWTGVLPSQGYFVLLPNPRGSLGFGVDFAQGNVKDFGYGDLRDILTGIDAAVAAAPIDAERVGLVGWSYGGYMAMWAPTQTTRFKAVVAGAGIVNWQSYYGQNRIDRWLTPYFGASVYDDPLIYARSSPITFIKQYKAAALVLHGERDSEVPAPQGYEFWHALKTLGVPTELVIYPDEGHRITKPEHLSDVQKRSVEWLDRYLK